MRRVTNQPSRLEALEPRALMSVESVPPGQGYDLQIVSDLTTDTTPVVSQTAEQFPRVPMQGGYQWYDGTGAQNLIAHGANMEYIMVDGWNIWPRDGNGVHREGEPSELNTRWLANYAITQTSTLVIDIENWAMDLRYSSRAVINQNIARFENMINWIRQEQPTLKVGIYSLFPVSDFYSSIQYELYAQNAIDPVSGFWYRGALPGVSNNYAKLQASDAFLSGLAAQVDFVMPSLYTSSPDLDLWRRYAVNTITEARRYGKPVVPFVMPTYHQGANLNLAVVAEPMWALQLATLATYADGAVIWTDGLAPTGQSEYWIQLAVNATNGTGTLPTTNSTGNLLGSSPTRDDRNSRFGQSLIADIL